MALGGEARVGEVVECSSTTFVAQSYRLYGAPHLGALVRTGGPYPAYGVVHEVATRGIDPSRRPTARGEDEATEEDVYRSNPQLEHLLRTDFRAVIVGHVGGGQTRYHLPPSPPPIYAFVHVCATHEEAAFSSSTDCLRLLAGSGVAALEEVVSRVPAARRRLAGRSSGIPGRRGQAAGRAVPGRLSPCRVHTAEGRSVMERDGAGRYLGVVIGGSMARGVDVRLSPGAAVEEMALGQHVVIQGQSRRFYGVVTDIALEWSDEAIRTNPPDTSNPLIAGVVASSAAYSTLRVLPMLAIEGELASVEGPSPARTVPPHFAPVRLASEEDVQVVFGAEDNRHFWVGSPLDMETRVCLDLEEFVTRSNGVFGKSGTGKSFLTRLLLAGILQKSAAVNLVFDMESEYGWMGTSEGTGMVKGIKQLFPSRVGVFSLDEDHSRRRGVSPDYLLRVGYNQIEPEDIDLLRENLNLSEVAADAAYALARHYGQERWVRRFLDLGGAEMRELAAELNVNERALSTLHNRLSRFRRFDFMTERESDESVEEILRYLDRGIHVVLEFGRYRHDLSAYMLVANLLTRRIHARYVRRKEEAMGDASREPRPLVITIEEAHRFLSKEVASQTTFGNIAREMRKYNVTLLVVDQRPSGIDEEIMSQLGTKLVCLLDNERGRGTPSRPGHTARVNCAPC